MTHRFTRTAAFAAVAAAFAVFFPVLAPVPVSVVETGAAHATEALRYLTGSGDRIRVTVFGHKDLTGEFLIDGSGAIAMPLIGDVQVGGFAVRAIEAAVIAKLKPDYLINPQVSVEVLNYRPFYILGEVKQPGSYPFVNGMTVLTAVAMGGGYTYRARENRTYITRATDPAGKKQPATKATIVLPGDVVEVPERFF